MNMSQFRRSECRACPKRTGLKGYSHVCPPLSYNVSWSKEGSRPAHITHHTDGIPSPGPARDPALSSGVGLLYMCRYVRVIWLGRVVQCLQR